MNNELTREELNEALASDTPITFSFAKKDGTRGTYRGTTNPNLIPEEHHPKSTTFFDLESGTYKRFMNENDFRMEGIEKQEEMFGGVNDQLNDLTIR